MEELVKNTGLPAYWVGNLCALVAALIWACSITAYRHYGKRYPAGVVNFNKLLVGTTAFAITIYFLKLQWPSDASTWTWLMISGIIGLAIGDTFFLLAIQRLGAPLTSALQNLTPPIAAILAWIFLNDAMYPLEITGLLLTMFAVSGVVLAGAKRDDQKTTTWRFYFVGVGLASVAAVCQSIAMVFTANYVKALDPNMVVLLRLLPTIPLMLLLNVSKAENRDGMKRLVSRPQDLIVLAIVALCGTYIGLTLLTISYKFISTGVATAISNTYPIWIIPIAALFLNERPNLKQCFWTVLAVVGIAVMMAGKQEEVKPKEITKASLVEGQSMK